MNNDIIAAHKFSINNKPMLENDSKCGCFHCLTIFHPKEIDDWICDTVGTAVCPYCGIDSVIGESSNYPITTEFLKEMNDYWFQQIGSPNINHKPTQSGYDCKTLDKH